MRLSWPPLAVPPLSLASTLMMAVPLLLVTGVKLKEPVALGLVYVTVGLGTMAGTLEVAVRVTTWPASLAGPTLIPVRFTVWNPGLTLRKTLLMGSRVGGSLTGCTVTTKVLVTESTPPLAVPPLSWTTTLMVAEPERLGCGVKVIEPVELGLV